MEGISVEVQMFATFGVLLVFIISAFTDIFAYAVGLTFRGPKLAPKISPKKTISGAVGGLFGGVIGTLALLMCCTQLGSPLSLYLTEQFGGTAECQTFFIIIGLVGSIISQAGDLYASTIKRKAGVKDFSNILPGHGGIMDRLDGISFNAIFIFICFTLILL
jgi:phosphatidate cytidylyltransferase